MIVAIDWIKNLKSRIETKIGNVHAKQVRWAIYVRIQQTWA